MIKDINSLGGLNAPKTRTEQGNKSNSAEVAPVSTATETPATADDVQISDGAKSLQALASNINELPDVNVARAEQIKAALDSGDYKIDDLVLAENILSSESLLGS